jgi:non-specific protein-tyrosine kinase
VDLIRLIALARRRLPLLVIGTLLAALASYAVSSVLPRTYSATATLLVFQTSTVGTAQLGDLMASERLAHTYANLMTRRPVLDQTIADLQLPMSAAALEEAIQVDLVRDTQLFQVRVNDADPARATLIANRLAEVFVAQLKTAQTQSFTDAQSHIAADMTANEIRRQETQQALTRLQQQGNPTDTDRAEIARLTGALNQLNATRDSLFRSAESIRMMEATNGTSVQIAERAIPPRDPISPKIPLNVALAAVVGLLFATGVAWFLEYLDNTIQEPEDAQEVLGVPALAQIRRTSAGRARAGGAAAPSPLRTRDDSRSAVAEAYRLLRMNVEFSDVDHPPRRLLVTSAVAGEGKSTVAANLAVVLAQAGRQVLLIDADLRRPTMRRIFDLPAGRGLTTLLAAGDTSAAAVAGSCVAAPGVPNLSLLLSGPLPPNPGDLLGSARMAALLDTLATTFDVLVIDSPPVLVATDPLVLARQVDGVLFVVAAGATRAPLVRQAGEALNRVGGRLLGVVLTKLARGTDQPYYAYEAHEEGPPAGAAAPDGESRTDPAQTRGGAVAERS